MVGLLAMLAACHREPTAAIQMLSGSTMGTTYSVKIAPHASMLPLKDIAKRVDEELKLVNDQMSTYIETSELSRFNASTSTEWFPVSADTAQVVALAKQIHEWTEGAFDVTVGPLVDMWGFGPQRRPQTLPSDAEIAEALTVVGSEKLDVQLDPPALKKSVAGLRVDLSAIAKGHGVDRVAAVLDDSGVENYFVEIGGEVRTRGVRQDGRPWQVGIEKPLEDSRELHTVVGVSGASLATSGDYRNFYRIEGKRYSHFIDPRTGKPAMSDMASASVLADSCALADGIATGLMAAGFERGLELAQANAWGVMLIAHRNERFEVASTPSFDELVSQSVAEEIVPAQQKN
jgi:FAD:protein FMN transferase